MEVRVLCEIGFKIYKDDLIINECDGRNDTRNIQFIDIGNMTPLEAENVILKVQGKKPKTRFQRFLDTIVFMGL